MTALLDSGSQAIHIRHDYCLATSAPGMQLLGREPRLPIDVEFGLKGENQKFSLVSLHM